MGIRGNSTGYQAKLQDHRSRSIDWNYSDKEPKPFIQRTVRFDLPAELLETIDILAEENNLSRNGYIVLLLKQASTERR